MTDRAGEAIEPDDDQGIAAADVAEEAGEHWAGAIGAGGVFLEDAGAARGAQLIDLRVGALFFGGRPGRSRSGGRGRGISCFWVAWRRLCASVGAFLQTHKAFINGRLQRLP